MLLASFAMHTMEAFGKMNFSAFEIEYTTNSLGKLYFESEKYRNSRCFDDQILLDSR